MTGSERRRCMRLLDSAKKGDAAACEELTATLAKHFGYMIRTYSSVDPAFDHDDLKLQFQLGIWQNIGKVDGRGDPLYHLAWRGRKAVCSMLNVIKQRRHGTAEWVRDFGEERSLGTLPEGWDPPDTRPETAPDHELLVTESRQEAREHVAYLMEHATLSPRQREVAGAMMSDPDLVDGDGANLRLAGVLDVSAQAASVLRRRVMAAMSGMDHSPQTHVCPSCGSELGSKGALTQHRKGQSGHKPCAAVAA